MQKIILLALTLAGINTHAEDFIEGPQLGQAVSAEEVLTWEIGVMPDGTGLPSGSGTVAQGKQVYQQYCLSCHGAGGLGDSADQLAGAVMTLTSEWPEKTVGTYWPYATTLFDFIRRSMPMTSPGVLKNDEVYAVTGYILFLNGVIKATDRLDAASLAEINMPNKNGFINSYGEH